MAPTAVDVAEVQMMKVEEVAVADVVGVAAGVVDVVAGEGVVAGVGGAEGAEGAEDVEGEVVAVEYHSDSNQQEVRGLGTSENKYTREGCD